MVLGYFRLIIVFDFLLLILDVSITSRDGFRLFCIILIYGRILDNFRICPRWKKYSHVYNNIPTNTEIFPNLQKMFPSLNKLKYSHAHINISTKTEIFPRILKYSQALISLNIPTPTLIFPRKLKYSHAYWNIPTPRENIPTPTESVPTPTENVPTF